MSLQLWTLAGLEAAVVAVVTVQVLIVVVLAPLVVFRLMGADYTAAVFSAGFVGDSLGSTSTAIANMSAVAKRYGAAPLAFVILPLVSAVLVNTASAFVIWIFVSP